MADHTHTEKQTWEKGVGVKYQTALKKETKGEGMGNQSLH